MSESTEDPVPGPTEKNSRGSPASVSPYVWQQRSALDRIKNTIGGSRAGHATQVYVALTRISSERRNVRQFDETISRIAEIAGFSYRLTHDCLIGLRDVAGVIAWQSTRFKGSKFNCRNVYKILTLPKKGSARRAEGGSAPDAEGFGKRESSSFTENRDTKEKNHRNDSFSESGKQSHRFAPPPRLSNADDLMSQLAPPEVVEQFIEKP